MGEQSGGDSDNDDAEVLTREAMLGKIDTLEAQVSVGLEQATGKQRKKLQAQLRQCQEWREQLAAVVLAGEVS